MAVELAEAPADAPQSTQVAEEGEEEEQGPGLLLHAEAHNLPQVARRQVGRQPVARRHVEARLQAFEAAEAQIAERQRQCRRSRQRTPVPNSPATIRLSSS